LPPQSTPGLLADDGSVLVQFLGEHLVNPIIAGETPSLAPRRLVSETLTRTELTGMDPASGRTSRAQCQAAIIMRSAVAFATLGRGQFWHVIQFEAVDSLIFQCRDVVCSTKFAGGELSNGHFSTCYRLPLCPRTQCDGDGDRLVLNPFLPLAHDQSLHKRGNEVILLALKTIVDGELQVRP
jgi:hypothetical protein